MQGFIEQFSGLDTDHKACFLFPESFISQFFVIMEVCKRADIFHPVKNLFPNEEKVHYLAVFDKRNMDDVLLMFHLLYTNASEDLSGGYSLYDYSLSWHQNHLIEDGIALRSPYLPDRLARYQGIQHYYPVEFFGGEEALAVRQEHDRIKKDLCQKNNIRLIEWPYDVSPIEEEIRKVLDGDMTGDYQL